jgi:hypothetical protein
MELSLPAVKALGSETAMIDAILGSTANTDHPAVLDCDVESAAVAAQQTGRRYPGINVIDGHPIDQVLIYAYGPGEYGVR